MDDAAEQSDKTLTGADPADVAALAPAVAPVEYLIALITNPAKCSARLRELKDGIAACTTAEGKLKKHEEALAARAAELDQREAALARSFQDLASRENALAEADEALREREAAHHNAAAAHHEKDESLRRRIARWFQLEQHPLRGTPEWLVLAREIFGDQPDPEFGHEEKEDRAFDPGFELNVSAGSSLTRSQPRSAATRRDRRHSIEPRLAHD